MSIVPAQFAAAVVQDIVLDMARVIGSDPGFVYASQYMDFIRKMAGAQAEPLLVSEGARAADSGMYEDSCRLLRTALILDPKSLAALYLYGRACKACSESDEDGELPADYKGSFKAESIETFELLTMIHPDFAMGYYFLGYAYLNMGLYLKARLTWDDFMKLSSDAGDAPGNDGSGLSPEQMQDLRSEIAGMLLDLEDPVTIERGCNLIMSGDYPGGSEILREYTESRYENWWPLWYYLGVAESSMGHTDEAVKCFRRVLRLSPSNTDAMEELAAIYAISGDEANAAKYRNKIDIVRRNAAEDAAGN